MNKSWFKVPPMQYFEILNRDKHFQLDNCKEGVNTIFLSVEISSSSYRNKAFS